MQEGKKLSKFGLGYEMNLERQKMCGRGHANSNPGEGKYRVENFSKNPN